MQRWPVPGHLGQRHRSGELTTRLSFWSVPLLGTLFFSAIFALANSFSFFVASLAKELIISFDFLKEATFGFIDFSLLFFRHVLFISGLIFSSFFELTLGLIFSSFFYFLEWELR